MTAQTLTYLHADRLDAALPRGGARSAVPHRRAADRLRAGRRPGAHAGRPAPARGVGAGLPDLDLAGDSGRPQPPGLCLPLEYALPAAWTKPRRKESWAACAASGLRKARTSSRCCAKRSSSRNRPLVDTDAQQQGGRRRRGLAGAGQRSSRPSATCTATVTVMDADAAVADEKLRMVERVIQGRGFVDHPRNAQRRGCVAVVHSGQRLRQCAPAHRLDAEPGAHDAGVGGVGWAGEERSPGRPAADRHAHRWRHAVPAGDAHRRRGPHAGRRPDRHGQVGVARHAGDAVPPLSAARASSPSTWAARCAPRILGLGGEHYDLGTDGEIAFQPLGPHRPRGLPHLGRRMDRRPLAARRRGGRPGREGGYLVGAGKPRRCAGGAAHDDGPFGAAAIERAAAGARAVCAGRRARQAAGCRP